MSSSTRALRASLLASCLLLPVQALAQEAQPTALPPIDVNSTIASEPIGTSPLSGNRVNAEHLQQRDPAASDTADILTRLPGVSANTGGGFSSMPAIRGLTEQRLTILVDGQPIDAACPNDMNSPLSYTNPQTIGSIHVVPGVAPVSMGGDNIGGVISVAAPEPRFATGPGGLLTGEMSAWYRSNGDGFGGSVSLTAASRHLSATYTGSYTQSDNYEGGGNRGKVRSSEYAKTDHALALAWHNDAGLFEMKGGYHFSPYEGFPNQYMDMVSNKSWFLNGRYRGMFDWGNVEASVGYRDTDHTMNFLADKLPGAMPMNTEVHSFTSALKFELPASGRDTLRFGGEYHHQRLDDWWPPVPGNMMMGPNTFININDAYRDRIGFYGEWEARWSERFSTLAGLRYDRVAMNTGDVQPYGTGMMNMADAMAAMQFNALDRKRVDGNWSGSLLFRYAPGSDLALELGYAHKVRSPNLYERYSWGRGSMASRMIGWYGDGNGYVGNPDLKPERADTVSATIALERPGGLTAKLSTWYTHVDDYIDAAFVQNLTDMMGMPTGFVQLRFANQEAEFYGVELSADIPLRKTANGETRLTASLAYIHGQNLSDKGPLYRQMPLDARLGVEHRSGAFEAGADLQIVDAKDRVDLTRNEPRTRSYALVNLRAAYTLGGVRLGVEAKNLFDKAYDLPLGGVSLGDYKATGALRPVPGRGRSIDVSLSTRF